MDRIMNLIEEYNIVAMVDILLIFLLTNILLMIFMNYIQKNKNLNVNLKRTRNIQGSFTSFRKLKVNLILNTN